MKVIKRLLNCVARGVRELCDLCVYFLHRRVSGLICDVATLAASWWLAAVNLDLSGDIWEMSESVDGSCSMGAASSAAPVSCGVVSVVTVDTWGVALDDRQKSGKRRRWWQSESGENVDRIVHHSAMDVSVECRRQRPIDSFGASTCHSLGANFFHGCDCQWKSNERVSCES